MKISKLAALILFGCLLFSACSETKPEKPRPPVGSTARLNNGSELTVGVLRMDYIDELSRILYEKDKEGLSELVSSGKGVLVEKGSKVKVMNNDMTVATQVEILEGRHEGRRIWTSSDWVKPE
jgi:hypothetical protein